MFGLAGFVSILGILLGLVAFAASVWLVVVAFKRSTPWGLLTLLVPFAAVAFAVKFWDESRKPFLISAAAGVASTILFFAGAGLAVSGVSKEIAREIAADPALKDLGAPSGPAAEAANQGAAPAGRVAEDASDDPAVLRVLDAAPVTPPRPAIPAAPKEVWDVNAVSPDGYAPVALHDAGELKGRSVKLLMANGKVHRGELLAADANGVSLQRWLVGGNVVVDYRKSEIEALYVNVN